MCGNCNYEQLLIDHGLELTPKRLDVLEVIGNNNCPLRVNEIFETLNRTEAINRTTVYRILDLYVEKGIVNRISGGERTFFYGLAPNAHHRPHPHFFCKICHNMECLSPDTLSLDTGSLNKTFPGKIDQIEVRVDGICRTCLRQ